MTNVNFSYLQELRSAIGPRYGSEDLCVLLYSIVKREQPDIVVELGTGFGVTTAWIAAAMKENGRGKIISFDNGAHFDQVKADMPEKYFPGQLETLRGIDSYEPFLKEIFDGAKVSEHVALHLKDMDMSDLTWLDAVLARENNGAIVPIDILFSDFSHSTEIVSKIVAQFLPRMSEVSSIFIDSASTSLGPYLMLERIVGLMQAGKVPKELISLLPNNEQRAELRRIVAESTFKLNHLTEKKYRAQNSTVWLRTEPAAILAGLTTCLH